MNTTTSADRYEARAARQTRQAETALTTIRLLLASIDHTDDITASWPDIDELHAAAADLRSATADAIRSTRIARDE